MRKRTGFVILFTNIVNFVAKHQPGVNHVVLVKVMDTRILREDQDVLLGSEIILCSYTESDKINLIEVILYTLLIHDLNFVYVLSFFFQNYKIGNVTY